VFQHQTKEAGKERRIEPTVLITDYTKPERAGPQSRSGYSGRKEKLQELSLSSSTTGGNSLFWSIR